MIAKGAYGGSRFAVDPVFTVRRRVRWRLDPGPKLDDAHWRFEFGRDREAAASAIARKIAQFRPAQPASRRKQRQGFKTIGLASPIFSGQHDEARVNGKIELDVGAKIGQREPPHTRMGESLDSGVLGLR